MTNAKLAVIVAVVGLVGLSLLGCGEEQAKEYEMPIDLVRAFDASMKSGNFQKAAGLFDFEEHERNINPAFDSLPIGEREMKIKTLRDQKARALEGWASEYISANYQIGQEYRKDDISKISLVGSLPKRVTCINKRDVSWRIYLIE